MGAALVGAAIGSVSGPVTACELSAALPGEVGACAPTGAAWGALVGALLGLVAAPLVRSGRRRRQPAAHRPAATTWAAAGLVMAAAVAVWVWIAELGASGDGGGLETLLLLWLGVPVAVGGAVLLVLASGLLRRRGWARWGVVVGFSLAGVAALAALLAALDAQRVGAAGDPSLHRPLPEPVPPAVSLLISVAVVALVLSPSTAEDFAASGQAPPPHEGPRQEGSAR